MSRDGVIELPFGDGQHKFRLAIKQWEDLERLRGIGPFILYDRIRDRSCFVGDIREVIRVGLIGGGMPDANAMYLVERFFDDWPLADRHRLALAIAIAGIAGPEDDPVGKEGRGKRKPSGSPASTGTASRRASRRKTSAA